MGLKYHLSLTNSHSHSATCLPIFPKATPKTTTTSPELVRRRLPFQSSPTTTLSKAVLTLRLLTAMSNSRDDNEAIDESNIIDEKTRHAKPTGSYREPGDEEGLPGPEDGTSSN